VAFPLNGVLDSFTRIDAPTLGANWTAPLRGTEASLTIVSNAANATAVESDYWNVNTFGPDCEAYFTIGALPTATVGHHVFARAVSPGASVSGYYVSWGCVIPGADTLSVLRIDAGVATVLGAALYVHNRSGNRRQGRYRMHWIEDQCLLVPGGCVDHK